MKSTSQPMTAHPQQAQSHPDRPRLLTQAQICERLGICSETWRVWRKARRVPDPVPNFPGRPRWREVDIVAFENGRYGAGGARVFFGSARKAS